MVPNTNVYIYKKFLLSAAAPLCIRLFLYAFSRTQITVRGNSQHNLRAITYFICLGYLFSKLIKSDWNCVRWNKIGRGSNIIYFVLCVNWTDFCEWLIHHHICECCVELFFRRSLKWGNCNGREHSWRPVKLVLRDSVLFEL